MRVYAPARAYAREAQLNPLYLGGFPYMLDGNRGAVLLYRTFAAINAGSESEIHLILLAG